MGRIIEFSVNLEGINEYIDGERDRVLISALKKGKIYDKTDLYSVFDYSDVDKVRESGFTRDPTQGIVFALRRSEISLDGQGVNSFSKLLKGYDDFAGVAVYDGNKMRRFRGCLVESGTREREGVLSEAVVDFLGFSYSSAFAYEFSTHDPRGALKGIARILV